MPLLVAIVTTGSSLFVDGKARYSSWQESYLILSDDLGAACLTIALLMFGLILVRASTITSWLLHQHVAFVEITFIFTLNGISLNTVLTLTYLLVKQTAVKTTVQRARHITLSLLTIVSRSASLLDCIVSDYSVLVSASSVWPILTLSRIVLVDLHGVLHWYLRVFSRIWSYILSFGIVKYHPLCACGFAV